MKLAPRLLLAACSLITPGWALQSDCIEVDLQPDVPQIGDSFGFSFRGHAVGLREGRALVGAPFREVGGIDSGAAFLFEEGPLGWSQVAQLNPALPTDGALAGSAVALGVDRAVVGAPDAFFPLVLPGQAFVYEAAGGWAQSAVLSSPGLTGGAHFGASVAVEGDRIVVGAPGGGVGGSVHVFELQAGAWVETQTLQADQPEDQDLFGSDVALQGNRIVVGAEGDRFSDGVRRGALYVFELAGGQWTQTARLEGAAPHTSLGAAVGLDGARIAGGADFASSGGPFPGAVWVWVASGAGWQLEEYLSPTPGNDQFGGALRLEGDRLLIGAPTGNQIYLYERGANGWSLLSTRQLTGAQSYGNSLGLSAGRVLVGYSGVDGPGVPGQGHLVPFSSFLIEAFCFCTEAGCSNTDPTAGCQNITGSGCRLAACGTTSLSEDQLVLTATNTGPDAFGIFFMGRTQTPLQFFGNGRRCVDDPVSILRFPVRNGGPQGVIHEGPGIVAFGQGAFPSHGQIMAGHTWNFQLWYRDPGACLTGFNVSNALAVTFTP